MPAFIDYSGKKIGRVSVISLNCMRSGGTQWNCRCACSEEFICWNASFRRGEKFECKKCMNERKRGVDLTGRKYGRWTVLNRTLDSNNKTTWFCRCDCGNDGYVATYALGRKGKSESCGCLGRKMKSKHVNTTLYPPAHGLSKSRFYACKTSLIHKCYNEKHVSYGLYGGSGITVCDLWRNGAKDMYLWAIENNWSEGDVFCLKSGEKEFNPTTVFIVKESEFRSQIGEKGGTQIMYQGKTHSVKKWAEILDVDPMSLRRKIKNSPSIDVVFNSTFRKAKFVRDPNLSKKAVELYLSGKNQTEIGNILGSASQNIRYHLLIEGIELRNDRERPKKPLIKPEQIIHLLDLGMSMNAISEQLGCSFTTIKQRILKHNGIKRDRSKG